MLFTEQLRAFAHKTDKRLNSVVKKIVFDISSKLVLRSPVGDASYWIKPAPKGYVGGRFRGNWQYGLGSINSHTDETTDKGGGKTTVRISKAIPSQAIGKIHFITNSLPYAIRLEQGHSKRQAPNGMVRLTQIEFDVIIRQAAAELV